jgi:predicted LPLAT superfamily acyltransferase
MFASLSRSAFFKERAMAKWSGKSKGTPLGYWFFIQFIRHLGLGFTYGFLHFVVAYYFLFSWKTSRAIYDFYRKGLKTGRWEAFWGIYRNYYALGQMLIDKVAMASGFAEKFDLRSDGNEHIINMAKENTGGILISAHVGNWEVAGHLLVNYGGVFNVVMYEAEHEQIKRTMEQETGGRRFNVIPIKDDMSHVYAITNALLNKEIVCLHGDRFLEGMRSLTHPFLGRDARFPFGPFGIASKFDVPKCFVFGMRKGKNGYAFSCTPPITGKQKPEVLLEAFVRETEKKVRQYPSQWFNFYDFWKQ